MVGVRALRINPQPQFPQQMLPVPFALVAAQPLPRDAAEVKQASLCFIHGLAFQKALSMPSAQSESTALNMAIKLSPFKTQMFALQRFIA